MISVTRSQIFCVLLLIGEKSILNLDNIEMDSVKNILYTSFIGKSFIFATNSQII